MPRENGAGDAMYISVPLDVYVLDIVVREQRVNPVMVHRLIKSRYGDEITGFHGKDRVYPRDYTNARLTRLWDHGVVDKPEPDDEEWGLYDATNLTRYVYREYMETGQTVFDIPSIARELGDREVHVPEGIPFPWSDESDVDEWRTETDN